MLKKRFFVFFAAVVFLMQACASFEDQGESPTINEHTALDTYEQRLSYLAAYDFHRQIVGNLMPLDMAAFQAGLSEAFSGQESRVSQEQAQADMKRFSEDLAKAPSNYEFRRVNVAEQTEYLNQNMYVADTITLQSGLQYRVVKEGSGKMPSVTDRVRVRYRGTYIDGTVFDESDPDGEPVEFGIDKTIKAWREALPMMQEGAVWSIAVPPGLGYGIRGNQKIPGNVVLLFEIELVDVVDSESDGDESAGVEKVAGQQ